MNVNLLEIEDLRVIYKTDEDTIYAVNGVDMSVKNGETMGLVGETGAGKTTTALAIMKLLPERTGFIKSGRITLDGIDITRATEHEMEAIRGNTVSMIFQDPMTSLNPTITVGRQIAEVLQLHEKSKSSSEMARSVDEMMELVGIPSHRKNEYPHQFSGGMKQRIVIAIALACKPKLLIADEPTTALDVTIQDQVLEMMNDLKERLGTSMILITHDLGVVAQTCDTVAIMYAGEIIERGRVEEVFDTQIRHPYTSGLFGSIPNIKVTARRLNPIDGLMPDPASPPDGCGFYERCPKKMEMCGKKPPLFPTEGNGHAIRCWLHGDCARRGDGS
ncbi:MAG: ABC transporter ATP-binding protein [Synergistaceae bacterium]|jgi:peptide/nickel transport system ATP-binding protein|nr:ABC transporter ATP-binding protein [Synergistaceae bacterium]